MDFRQLEIFIKIVELKSFSKAAEAVYITQPTVSAHMQSLENALGLRLLDRLGREVAPTMAGKVLFRHAKRLMAVMDEAKQDINRLKGKTAGRVVVGGSTIPGEYILPKRIGMFGRAYPGISVSLLIGDTSSIAEKVLLGECELGAIGSKVEDSRLKHLEFIQDELVLIAAPGYALPASGNIRAKDIASSPFVIRERGSGSRMAMERWLAEIGVNPAKLNIVAEMGSTEAVKQAVKAGLGISIVSSLALEEDLCHKTLRSIPFQGKKLLRKFYLVSCPKRSMSPICQAFLKFLMGEDSKASDKSS